jgi:hypothetical protein
MTGLHDTRIDDASKLMHGFARRTGLAGADVPQVRYLWTDAYATVAFQAIGEATGDPRLSALAAHTIEQVHRELVCHRRDEPRQGWLSGAHGSARRPDRCRPSARLPRTRAGDQTGGGRTHGARAGTGNFGGIANTRRLVEQLMQHARQRSSIEDFWREPENRSARSWTAHLDINEVMLATSLAPDGWLLMRPLS